MKRELPDVYTCERLSDVRPISGDLMSWVEGLIRIYDTDEHAAMFRAELATLRTQLAAKERECEELRTHLVATANQVQDNCWCAPGDKCPAHAARDYLQEITP